MKKAIMSIVLVCWVTTFGAQAQTWVLHGKEWQQVGNDEQGRFLLAISQIKQDIVNGNTQAAQARLAALKSEFPRIAGPDLEAFLKADLIYAKGKFTDAIPEFNKFLDEYPTSPLYDAALEREFQMGTALLGGYKVPLLKIFRVKGYEEGVKTMEKLADRAGDAPIAQQALIAVARHYEKRKLFRQAYDTWADIASRWPTGELGKESLLWMARDMHSSYKGPRYDASGLASSKGYYENFKLRYPEDAKAIGVDAIIAQINEQMAYKDFSIGKYYQKTKSNTAASLYYTEVVDSWPDSTAGKAAAVKIQGMK